MKNEDRELKIFLADSMMRQRDADCYTEKERKALRNLALYLEAHIACLDGDYAFAWDRFSRMNNENPEDDALFEFLMEHFERDLLYAAVWKGDRRTARRALDRLLLRTKPDTPAHRHWTFTKRRLENDVPGQIAVLRLLVKDYPNDARYAFILKELEENAKTGEAFGAPEAAKTKPEAADPRSALRREAAP